MSKFAVINDNIVTNVILSDSKEMAESVTNLTCLELSETDFVEIGDTWDGEKFLPKIV